VANVLIVLSGCAPALAGAESMAWRTALHLDGRGHRVAVLAGGAGQRSPGGTVEVVSEDAVGAAGEGLPWQPDVVHFFDLARPRLLGLGRDVAAHHGARFALTPASAVETWPDREQARAACAAADVVFALTGSEASVLRGHGARGHRVVLVAQGPELAGAADRRRGRSRLGLPPDVPIALFVGRRVRFKGYRVLLDAAPLVWPSLPDAAFAFVGPSVDPDAGEAFRALPDPRIRDLGLLDGPAKSDVICACDVLCLPTSADIFPLVFVEAWTCGRPVISGDYAGAREVVRDGVDGLVVPSQPGPVAVALVELLSKPARCAAMGEAGRRRACAELTWERVAHDVEAGYRLAGVR
jgi:glycosyltransferase involved in cell wall biosynthesis